MSSRAAAEEMLEVSPKLMQTLVAASRGIVSLGAPARALLGLLARVGVHKAAYLNDAAPFIVESFGDPQDESLVTEDTVAPVATVGTNGRPALASK